MTRKVSDFRTARRNANNHTARGLSALDKSIRGDGWIGAMTTAADNEMIAGSARLERAADVFGTDAEPIVIESDGTRPIVVRRTDIPTAADPRAVGLSRSSRSIVRWLLKGSTRCQINCPCSFLARVSLEDLTADETRIAQLDKLERWATMTGKQPVRVDDGYAGSQ